MYVYMKSSKVREDSSSVVFKRYNQKQNVYMYTQVYSILYNRTKNIKLYKFGYLSPKVCQQWFNMSIRGLNGKV